MNLSNYKPMKGILRKKGSEWFVKYANNKSIDYLANFNEGVEKLPLHPDDVKTLVTGAPISIHLGLLEGSAVEFEFDYISRPTTYDQPDRDYKYAKLIIPSKEETSSFECKDSDCKHCTEDIAQMKEDRLFTTNFTDTYKETAKTMELLRRVYNLIEMSHLNDGKMNRTYLTPVNFPRGLGDDIFNYLQSKDQVFRDIVIKRQKRYRNKHKKQTL